MVSRPAASPPRRRSPDDSGSTPASIADGAIGVLSGALDRAPGAYAATFVCTIGLTAGYVGAGRAIAIAGGFVSVAWLAVGRGTHRRRRRIWIGAAALVSIRITTAIGAAESDARVWASLAAGGETPETVAVVRVTSARAGERGRWRLGGIAEACDRAACEGARLRWSWQGERVPAVGERWTIAGRLVALPPPAAFGTRFPPPALGPWARRGEIADVRVESTRAGRVPLLATVEQHLRARIVARFGTANAPLVTALLLGDRSAIDPALYDAFAAAGALHLLAVSGLHVGFLAWLLTTILGSFGLRPARRAAIASTLLVTYAALVGARPSVIRAVLMLAALLWSGALERRVSVWHLWGMAAVAILAWRPLDLYDLGFTLSFGAVAGLLAWGGPLAALVPVRASGRSAPLLRLLAAGTIATGAASLGTLPVQALGFGWLAPAGFLVNPFIVPLAGVALPLAWATLAVDAIGLDVVASPLSATVGTTIGAIQVLVVEVGTRSARWVPGGVTRALLPVILGSVAAYAMGPRAAMPWGAAGIVIALALPSPPSRSLEIVWLDVGQGDAIVIHFPDGATWLVDAGPAYPEGDAGRSVVTPYLLRRGVGRIDWLITTHPDLDHVGGAASVAAEIPVDRWGSPAAIADSPAYLDLLARTSGRAIRLGSGDRLRQGGVAIDVLHPPPEWVRSDPEAFDASANEGSVVLLIEHGGCRALLTGDIGERSETRLIDAFGDSLAASLLHVGHHGSRHSTTASFISRVGPDLAVISVGRFNRHGHPHAEVIERLGAAGSAVHRTDRDGAVRARCVKSGWRVESAGSYFR